MEALWTKFMPHYKKVMQMISDGNLGEIKSVLVNFGFVPTAPVPEQNFQPFVGRRNFIGHRNL